ncbi:host cell division inhibitor Icd-like protein [Serratia fonticola]|nr:host cell division inhibitor Icd-like protein [Serratia fonticola]
MNCPVVSPSSFTDSIASTTSCGARACTFCDFALTAFVATDEISLVWWRTVYTKYKLVKCLTCLHLENKVEDTLIHLRCKNSEAQKDGNPIWASNHNVIGANTMACQHSTQTRPKFVCIFLVIAKEFPVLHPDVLRVEADTEDEGRAKFVGWTLIFAAQIRTEAPCRLQLFSTDEGFMWVYEQRQTVKESSHA